MHESAHRIPGEPRSGEILPEAAPSEETAMPKETAIEELSYPDLIEKLENDKTLTAEFKLKTISEAIRNIGGEVQIYSEKERSEKARLRTARKELNLDPDASSSNALEQCGRTIDLLARQEQALIKLKKKIQAEPAELSHKKSNAESSKKESVQSIESGATLLSEELRRLTGALHQRERDGLTPLVEPRNLSRITGASERFSDISIKGTIDANDVRTATALIQGSLEDFGTMSSAGVMKENRESLQRVKFAIEEIAQSVRQLEALVREDSNLANVSPTFNRLEKRLEGISDFLARKTALLEKYS